MTYSDFVPLTSPASSPRGSAHGGGVRPGAGRADVGPRATVPPGYFQFMGIRLLEGRDFTERDEGQAPPVMIVNETFARRFFGDRSPVGRTVRIGRAPVPATIVAVVKDSKYDTPIEPAKPVLLPAVPAVVRAGAQLRLSWSRPTGDPMLAVPEPPA